MVRRSRDLRTIVGSFIEALKPKVNVDRVLLTGNYAGGDLETRSDIRLIVVSRSFEGRTPTERIELMRRDADRIEPRLQVWGYTPGEVDGAMNRTRSIPELSMLLNDSRQVYPFDQRAAEAPGTQAAPVTTTTTFGRLLTAMVTPFDAAGEVDYAQAQQLARALLALGQRRRRRRRHDR